MKKWVSIIVGLVLIFPVHAKFKYSSKLDSVAQSGYYQVELRPEMLGVMQLTRADVRLYNSAGKEVPYVIEQSEPWTTKTFYRSYTTVQNNPRATPNSFYIFKNNDNEAIDNVVLRVKNTQVNKRAVLSGSNTITGDWYIIRDNIHLSGMYDGREVSELVMLNFPKSDYRFYKLEILDSNELPIQILDIGYYDFQREEGVENQVEITRFDKADSNQSTWFHVHLTEPIYAEGLQFQVEDIPFYHRNVRIYEIKKRKVKRKKRRKSKAKWEPVDATISMGVLRSNSLNRISFPRRTLQDFYIEIINEDDQPIQIESILAYSPKTYLIAELSAGESYHLEMGDGQAKYPTYDIARFRDQLPSEKMTVAAGAMIDISPKKKKVLGEETPPYVLWISLGVVAIILGFVSYRMIKEMGGKKHQEPLD